MTETMLTPSEPTNHLITLATRILQAEEGESLEAVGEEFEQRLVAQMNLVESELEEVPERARNRGEGFVEANSELFDALIEHMRLYHEGLMELAAFLEAEEPDGSHLESGVQRLAEVTPPLAELQLEYGRVFAAFGSSRFPMINTLEHLLSEYRADPKQHKDEVDRVLAMMLESLKASLKSMTDDDVGVEEARSGCQRAIEIMEQLSSEVENHQKHSDHINALGEALFEMETGDEELRLSMLEGPSVMPAANIFINTARRAMDGKLPVEAVAMALEAYTAHVTQNWEAIERQLERPIDSASVQDELPNTMELVDAHEELVDRMEQIIVDGFDHDAFEEAIKDLIEVVELFKGSAQVFIDAAGRVGQLVCVACGRGQPRTNRVCEACGASLPKIVDDEQSESTFELSEHGGLEDDPNRMMMTTNIARIFKACEDVLEGNIDAAEFEATLRWADGLLQQMGSGQKKLEAELAALSQGAEEHPERHEELASLTEVLAFFEEGIDEWEAGLEEMARYLEEPEARHLKSGMKRVWEGASAIHRCKIIGDAAAEQLAEREAQTDEGEETIS